MYIYCFFKKIILHWKYFVQLFIMLFVLNSVDLEEQCEDVVFELCDARERYPLLCVKELQKFIKLTNEIHVSALYRTDNYYFTFYLSVFIISVICYR